MRWRGFRVRRGEPTREKVRDDVRLPLTRAHSRATKAVECQASTNSITTGLPTPAREEMVRDRPGRMVRPGPHKGKACVARPQVPAQAPGRPGRKESLLGGGLTRRTPNKSISPKESESSTASDTRDRES